MPNMLNSNEVLFSDENPFMYEYDYLIVSKKGKINHHAFGKVQCLQIKTGLY